MPYVSMDELFLGENIFCRVRTRKRELNEETSVGQWGLQRSGARLGGRDQCQSQNDNSPAMGHAMSIISSEPFANFQGLPASETTQSGLNSILNALLRQPHEGPLWNDVSHDGRTRFFVDRYMRFLDCGVEEHNIRACNQGFLK